MPSVWIDDEIYEELKSSFARATPDDARLEKVINDAVEIYTTTKKDNYIDEIHRTD